MKKEGLTEWLKRGYDPFKEAGGLPEWALPARSFSEVVDEVGDDGILELSRPVELDPIMKKRNGKLPPPDTVPLEDFQKAARSWELIARVKPVIEGCFDSRVMLTSFKEDEVEARADVLRSVTVLAIAPFSPVGKSLLDELAPILGGDKEQPAELLGRYVSTVIQNDLETVRKVSGIIKGNSKWQEWSTLFARKAMSLKSEPRVIAVTPPLSADIAWVIAQMIREDVGNEPERDHSNSAAGQGRSG
ncbi:MAG: hypothetical protein PHQ43_09485 [Dehalococcoidales bacterium]|nr:hypothetical protein [Dehalococcoidales bacterium]